ncbi:MAG TPA: hypothetical protein ENL20_05825, partial [Candidatus Cloacimonetes bacterium]|nr:hypothetical protein [Candidatus Cloacimonadota bacterium]
MKNTDLVLGILLTLLLATNIGLVAGTYSGGIGTSGEPYQIATLNDLQELSTTSADWGNYFEQTADINASATSGWNGGAGFSPIGSESGTHFKGYYDGNFHTISNLYINRPSSNDVGLFGYTDRDYSQERSYIKNLGLENVNITGGYRTAGLVGRAMSNISLCFVTGSVTGSAGNSVAAGLSAQSHYEITDCYSGASVSAVYEAAGFVSFNNGSIDNCYSTGAVSDATTQDGFCNDADGHGSGVITNSFWDTQTSGQSSSSGGTGKTTAEMKNIRTFTDVAWSTGLSYPWDFVGNPYDDIGTDNYWNIDGSINDGYPYLQDNPPDGPTPVELSTFTAIYANGSSLLEWTTQSESNNQGWNIYRSETDLEDAVQINGSLIQGAGTSTEPTEYEFEDVDNLLFDTTYNYWLE